MRSDVTDTGRRDSLVVEAAQRVAVAFDDYNASFSDVTRRARRRFEQGDRAGMRADVVARLNLYDQVVDEAIARLEHILANRLFSRSVWKDIHAAFAGLINQRLDAELYKTFFNTITRRVFKTRGVDDAIEFVALDIQPTDRITHPVSRHTYAAGADLAGAFARILADHGFSLPYADIHGDAVRLADRLYKVLADSDGVISIELLETMFYREGRAYLVGRAFGRDRYVPCVIALRQRDGLVHVDAMLTRRRQLSILFGYTFSYFLADLPTVGDAVVFLRTLLPDKPIDELYTVLGRAKQGKTERYRAFFSYLIDHREERLVEADGERGMVMLVFTLPGYPLVFKLIRDRFAPTKKFGRHQVIKRYRLVYRHDRVGRLLDVQQFKDLRFDCDRFGAGLLEQLESECARSVQREGESIVIQHCYVERRVRPLDLHLSEVDAEAARQAVIGYGQALKDLARSNIFAGDLLPKNFGVTRSGRVIFYDYDELRLMAECRFRKLPAARDDLLEFHDEPWFSIDDNDVFPEQFPRFMGLNSSHSEVLARTHGDLFDPAWWQRIQSRLDAGEALDVPPYGPEALLENPGSGEFTE